MPTRRPPEDYSHKPAPSDLDNIRIVLVRTFHPGNIGSVARAMKTMGLTDLALVKPWRFPSEEADKMALSAEDILRNATVYDDIPSAIADCKIVIASTARIRDNDRPEVSPETAAANLLSTARQDDSQLVQQEAEQTTQKQNKAALMLGPERMGLHNDDIQYATHRVTIPTSPNLQSLNIAAAAQTLCYEIYKQFIANDEQNKKSQQSTQNETQRELADRQDHERFYTHLETTIRATGFIRPGHGGPIMQRLRALFARAEPDKEEMNILRAILASIDKKTD